MKNSLSIRNLQQCKNALQQNAGMHNLIVCYNS